MTGQDQCCGHVIVFKFRDSKLQTESCSRTIQIVSSWKQMGGNPARKWHVIWTSTISSLLILLHTKNCSSNIPAQMICLQTISQNRSRELNSKNSKTRFWIALIMNTTATRSPYHRSVLQHHATALKMRWKQIRTEHGHSSHARRTMQRDGNGHHATRHGEEKRTKELTFKINSDRIGNFYLLHYAACLTDSLSGQGTSSIVHGFSRKQNNLRRFLTCNNVDE